MAAEEVKIPRVYLTDPNVNRRSAHHTIYASDAGPVAPGVEAPLIRLEFEFGVARQVPKTLYDRFHALGHVTTERPKAPIELEND